MSEYLDFITIDIWHIAMAMGNLVILALIVKRFLWKPVKDILRKRQEAVDGVFEEADTALARANADKRLYNEKLASVRAEADAILRSAAVRADERGAEIIRDAKQKSVEIKKHTELELDLQRKQATDTLKDDITDIALGLAQNILSREISADTHRDLIDAAIGRISEE